jgi:transposase
MIFTSSPNKLLRNLLGFKELIVTSHDMLPRKGILHLWVKPHKNGACCPECARRCKLVRRSRSKAARDSRTWRDIPAGGLIVTLHYSPREIYCPTHGRRQEEIPWAAPMSRNTLRLECQLLHLCKAMTQKEAAAQLGIPASTVADALHRVIARCREGHKIRGLKNLGIDEISYKKRHHYLTIVYDLERSQRRIFRACILKDQLSHFWSYTYIGCAEKFLKRWCKSAKLSRIEPLRKFVRMVDAHWNGVMTSVTGITNAVAEGINRLIRMAKNRASGFRSTNNFANMIYLIAGDLDLPAQIAPANRPHKIKPTSHKALCL